MPHDVINIVLYFSACLMVVCSHIIYMVLKAPNNLEEKDSLPNFGISCIIDFLILP